MTLSPLFEGLNASQSQVVRTTEGPVLVLAGAGTGKTEALTRRMAYMVLELGVDPKGILAVTFSRDAASQMNTRLHPWIGSSSARVGTFHSVALGIIREEGLGGLDWEVQESIRPIIRVAAGWGDGNLDWKQADLSYLESFVSAAKVALLSPSDPETRKLAIQMAKRDPGPHALPDKVLAVYKRTEELRVGRGVLTFDDFVPTVVFAFRADENLRVRWASRWSHILQDEAQDQGLDQLKLAELLASDHTNYLLVGDPGQSIYAFRGARPDRLLDFPKRWPGATVIKLEENYRSRPAILTAANQVVAEMGHGDATLQLQPTRTDAAEIHVVSSHDFDTEASDLAVRFMAYAADDTPWRDMAVLVRTNAQSRALEEAFLLARVPYVIKGTVNFYERREVKDLLSYLRLVSVGATEEEFLRIINVPNRYLGKVFAEAVSQAYSVVRLAGKTDGLAEPLSFWTLRIEEAFGLARVTQPQKTAARAWVQGLSAFASVYKQSLLPKASENQKRDGAPTNLLQRLVEALDYLRWLTTSEGRETPENSRVSNVREMIRAAARFDTTAAYLAHVEDTVERAAAARRQKAPHPDAVTITTCHRCVHPDTLVETTQGLLPIRELPPTGVIATPSGPQEYLNRTNQPLRDAYKVTTRSGYTLTMSPEHGMTVWRGGEPTRVEGCDLRVGDILRLRLGATVDTLSSPHLHEAQEADVRARLHDIPTEVTGDFAEFLGLFVADGTLYHSGFRLVKSYSSVVERFAELCGSLFGIPATIGKNGEGTPAAWVNSTFLSAWLAGIQGLSPHAKHVPEIVLRSPLAIQARFLRGLFEDGTVNEEAGFVDHIHWDTKDKSVADTVQTMLLRFGIISAVREHSTGDRKRITTLYVYSRSAALFRDRVGFVSPEKNARLSGEFARELNYAVPITRAELDTLQAFTTRWERQNGRYRGYLSRHVVRELSARAGSTGAFLEERLGWHFEAIRSIERVQCETMCVEVPVGSRFLQNGFDGWNSKGLEWPIVAMVGVNEGILPHFRGDLSEERRLFYVGMTRARDTLVTSFCRVAVVNGKVRNLEPSRFIATAGLSNSSLNEAASNGVEN